MPSATYVATALCQLAYDHRLPQRATACATQTAAAAATRRRSRSDRSGRSAISSGLSSFVPTAGWRGRRFSHASRPQRSYGSGDASVHVEVASQPHRYFESARAETIDVGGEGHASPERELADQLKHFFTWLSVRIVLRQLQELGSQDAFLKLHKFASAHSLRDGDQFIRELMNDDQSMALRVLKVREMYAKESFEWSNMRGLVEKDLEESNLEIMREYVLKTSGLEL
eukprot:tig00020553_g10657.t1